MTSRTTLGREREDQPPEQDFRESRATKTGKFQRTLEFLGDFEIAPIFALVGLVYVAIFFLVGGAFSLGLDNDPPRTPGG
jgi:hypothetical protein